MALSEQLWATATAKQPTTTTEIGKRMLIGEPDQRAGTARPDPYPNNTDVLIVLIHVIL
jgi:hypothetical protein